MTARQFAAWRAWLEAEWDEPDRHDWYAIQTAAEVRNIAPRVFGGKLVDPRQMKIPFRQQAPTFSKPPASREEATVLARGKWLAAGGIRLPVKERSHNADT